MREAESTYPHKQNIYACIKKADVVLNNNKEMEELNKKIDNAMNELGIE